MTDCRITPAIASSRVASSSTFHRLITWLSPPAANLADYVMPKAPLRQWVLTVPFSWRSRLGFDGALLGAVARKLADAVLAFYRRRRLGEEHGVVGQSGAVLVVQRTSSDLRLNPHVHVASVFMSSAARAFARGTRRLRGS